MSFVETTEGELRLRGGESFIDHVPPTQLVLEPAVRGPIAYGPRVTQPGTVVPDCEVVVTSRADPSTIIVRLDQSYSRRWLDQLNEPGSGSLVLQNDDPDLALISSGDMLTFHVHGWATLSMLARQWQRTTIAPGEEVDQSTLITGPGHLAVLEEAIVYPARGWEAKPAEEDRRFDWTAPDFDDSGWGNAVESVSVNYAQSFWQLRPFAEGFPTYYSTMLIWDRPDSWDVRPPGHCYFRRTYTSSGGALIFAVMDDGGQLYFDGQLVLSCDEGFAKAYTLALTDVTPGEHTIAIHGENGPGSPEETFDNPAGVGVQVWPCDANGQPVGSFPDVATSAEWKMVAYPPLGPPGWTPGEVLRHVIEEGQARGALHGVTLDFDDDVDSDGVPWPNVGDISTKCGTDVLTFLRELSATYVDFTMAPRSLVLRAFNRDGRGEDTDVDYHGATDPDDPLSGNIATLAHTRVDTPANRLLVRWNGGWRQVERAAATGARREALLGLGAAGSTAQVDRIAESQLDVYADVRTAVSLDIVPTGESDTPYLAAGVGDTVLVPGWDGTPTRERVLAITAAEDELGVMTFALECKDVILQAQERWEEWLKKMSNGTMRGDSKVATPVSNVGVKTTSDCCPPSTPTPGG